MELALALAMLLHTTAAYQGLALTGSLASVTPAACNMDSPCKVVTGGGEEGVYVREPWGEPCAEGCKYRRVQDSLLFCLLDTPAGSHSYTAAYQGQQVCPALTSRLFFHTGSSANAGSDIYVNITFVRTKDQRKIQTEPLLIDESFASGSANTVSLTGMDVNFMDFIIGSMTEKTPNSQWYLEKMVVDDGQTFQSFPHFKWIQDKSSQTMENPLVIYSAVTRLPQDDTLARKEARGQQTEQCKKLYKWSYDFPTNVTDKTTTDTSKTLPGFFPAPQLTLSSLDINFRHFVERQIYRAEIKTAFKEKFLMWYGNGVITEIDDYEQLSSLLSDHLLSDHLTDGSTPESAWLDNWQSDKEFGRQLLNGGIPDVIYRVRQIPANFPVTDALVAGLLGTGETVEEAARQGSIYMVDHGILEGISTGWLPTQAGGQGRRLEVAPAMVLLYHNRLDNSLSPIAIQLGQTPGADCPVWTPNDSKEDWLLAKIWFKHATEQVGPISRHLAITHFFVEPFAVAMHRVLPPAHPVHKLLKDHLKYVIDRNTAARESFASPDIHKEGPGSFSLINGANGGQELVSKTIRQLNFSDLHYGNNLKERDMMELPGYHHRDDAVKLWDAITTYVTGIINIFYLNNEDVVSDWELQNWVDDVFTNGFGKMEGTVLPSIGLPSQLKTKEDLTNYLTILIFTTSVRHTFVSYSAFEYARFAPNAPGVMRGVVPTEKGKATDASILDSLPTVLTAVNRIGLSVQNTLHSPDEIYLGETPCWMFGETEAMEVMEQFRLRLRRIEVEIEERNRGLAIPYTVLRPSRIPTGIAA